MTTGREGGLRVSASAGAAQIAPIRVLLVDDQRMFVDALRMVLEGEPDITFLEPASTGEAAIEACAGRSPDVVLMDLRLPGMDGLEATREIVRSHPNISVVVLSALIDQRSKAQAIEAGARGFLSKMSAADEVASVIRRVTAGEMILPVAALSTLVSRIEERRRVRSQVGELLARLTRRERDVLQMMTWGCTTADIAERLKIAKVTVQSHVNRILTKLGVRTRLQAVMLIGREGGAERASAV
ncbi:MAG: response regulator [Actinomycetota bacterium]